MSLFFAPAVNALGRERYNAGRFLSLPMEGFCAFGCLRHLMGLGTEQIQQLFQLTDTAKLPVVRSTHCDAICSERRLEILEQSVKLLANQAQALLPDWLADIPGLGDRAIYAVDGSYQHESADCCRQTRKHGGEDNSRGHMMLAFFDMRMGAPVAVAMETRNYHEMRVVKDYGQGEDSPPRGRHALWVVDRAYADIPF